MDKEVQQLVDSKSTARGLVLIVTNDYKNSCVENLRKKPLPACHIDGEKMRKTFSEPEMNFALLPMKKNCTAEEIKGLIKQVAKCNFSKSNTYEYFIFVYSGHGSANNCIVADDGGKVNIQHDIVDPLEPGNTSAATGKIVKLFFFNSCRGGLKMDSPTPLDATNERGNYIIAYATMEDYKAYETKSGSKWMVPLAKRLREEKSTTVQHILSEMVEQVRSSPNFNCYQNPEFDTTCGPVYLYPGIHGGLDSSSPPAPNDPVPQPLTKTPDSVATASISGGNEAIIAAGEKSMAGGKSSTVVGGNYTQTVHHNYYSGQPPLQLQGASAAAPLNTTPSQPLGGPAAGHAGFTRAPGFLASKQPSHTLLISFKTPDGKDFRIKDSIIGLLSIEKCRDLARFLLEKKPLVAKTIINDPSKREKEVFVGAVIEKWLAMGSNTWSQLVESLKNAAIDEEFTDELAMYVL